MPAEDGVVSVGDVDVVHPFLAEFCGHADDSAPAALLKLMPPQQWNSAALDANTHLGRRKTPSMTISASSRSGKLMKLIREGGDRLGDLRLRSAQGQS
jgi:hypothetical protein